MAKRKSSLALAEAIAARAGQAQKAGLDETNAPPRRRTYASAQEGLLTDLGEGRLRSGKIRQVDPARCRMWAGHNRLYDLLNYESCESLIASIKALGRQEMPAIVRPVDGDPDHDYEVVCGARRHYAVTWLRENEHRTDLLYLVDVRDLSDEEAFRVSDAENRDREDISDYERSKDYGRALADYYQGNKKLMAERIGVDRSWLSRFIRIAELPSPVIEAFGDPRRVGIKYAAELSPLLGSIGGKRLLKEATRLAEIQALRMADGSALMDARTVFRMLKVAAEGKTETAVVTKADQDGKPYFRLEHRQRSVVVTIPRDRLEKVEEVLARIAIELSSD